MRHGGSWEGSYPGNWKIAVEGAIEDYHLPWGHPELMTNVVQRNARVDFAERCFAAVSGRFEYPAGAGPVLTRLKRAMPSMPVKAPAEAERYFVINLFPVGLMTLRADTVMLGLFTPDGPDRTRLVFHHYFAGEAASDPSRAQQRQEIMDNLAYVAEQDIGYVKGVQSNLATRDRLDFPTRFCPIGRAGCSISRRWWSRRSRAKPGAWRASPRRRNAARPRSAARRRGAKVRSSQAGSA